jgi:hypothetical protein
VLAVGHFVESDHSDWMDENLDCVISCKSKKSMCLSWCALTCTDPFCDLTSINIKFQITLIIYMTGKMCCCGSQIVWEERQEARFSAKQEILLKYFEGKEL